MNYRQTAPRLLIVMSLVHNLTLHPSHLRRDFASNETTPFFHLNALAITSQWLRAGALIELTPKAWDLHKMLGKASISQTNIRPSIFPLIFIGTSLLVPMIGMTLIKRAQILAHKKSLEELDHLFNHPNPMYRPQTNRLRDVQTAYSQLPELQPRRLGVLFFDFSEGGESNDYFTIRQTLERSTFNNRVHTVRSVEKLLNVFSLNQPDLIFIPASDQDNLLQALQEQVNQRNRELFVLVYGKENQPDDFIYQTKKTEEHFHRIRIKPHLPPNDPRLQQAS